LIFLFNAQKLIYMLRNLFPALMLVLILNACHQEAPKPVATTENGTAYDTLKGLNYVITTQKVLNQHLMATVHKGGVGAALAFCNENAIRLTDSVADANHIKIKRVSDKNRNPSNAANKNELRYIAWAKERLAAGKRPKPKFEKTAQGVQVYFPIITQNLCLKCHGQIQTDVPDSLLKTIRELYPNDKAIGYKENELRGIWVLEMMDEKKK
jgi:hypothetical protein